MFQVKKILDEGTREPFIARLLCGILELRDHVQIGRDLERYREEFDSRYHPVLTALQVAREAVKDVVSLVTDHSAKVNSGAIIEFQRNAVSFRENIDRPLHEATSRLLVNGVIALKKVQEVTKLFDIDVGGFFQKEARFEKAMKLLGAEGHFALEGYLRAARQTWTESFIQCRGDLEHGGWTVPEIEYEQITATTFRIREPKVCDLPVSEFARISASRLFSFVENVVVYALNVRLPDPITVLEIPPVRRDPDFPRRFKVILLKGRTRGWLPIYSDEDFL